MGDSAQGRQFRFGVVSSRPRSNRTWPEIVAEVDELGYSTLMMTDHLDGQLSIGPALGMAAALSPRLHFGSLVYCNDLYAPTVLAREAATLAHLSGGRFEFGLGAGWDPRDYAEAGLEMRPPLERIARLDETISAVRRYFDRDHPARIRSGPRLSTVDSAPPILVGGGGHRMLRLAGAQADIVSFNPRMPTTGSDARTIFGPPNDGPGMTGKVKVVAEAAGGRLHRIELSTTVFAVIITNDRHAAAGFLARNAGIDREDVLSTPHALIGTVAQIADQVCERRDQWGLSYLVVNHRYRRTFAPIVEQLAGR